MNSPGPAAPLVLVADNDTAVSTLLREVLGRRGLRTAAVGDGLAALGFLAEHEVALLVCDLDMPELGGREVLARLVDMVDPPPVLVVSGFLDDALERAIADLAVVRGAFRKPFDIFEFADLAQQVVGGGAADAGHAAGSGS